MMGAVGLYLDLLKKALRRTVYTVEASEEAKRRSPEETFITSNGLRFRGCRWRGPIIFQFCIDDGVKSAVAGELIEIGVSRGGATIFMRAILKTRGVTDRLVWVADSFEGLPEPDAGRFPIEAETHNGALMTKVYGRFAADLEAVKSNFRAYGLLDGQIRFLKGWFKDTLPSAPISALAVMGLDGDYYESTMDAVTNDKLSVGGYAIS